MRLVTTVHSARVALAIATCASTLLAASAGAASLRAPQVVVPGSSLQGFLSSKGQSINVLTDQVNGQSWLTTDNGNTGFTLMIELSENGGTNSIGVYNCGDPSPNPTLFQIFPAAATAGWTANAYFSAGRMSVILLDELHRYQGQTNYMGVDGNNFGWYIDGPTAPPQYSEDSRNSGGEAHMLSYVGTGTYYYGWWACFEEVPWSRNQVDFDDAVLLLQAVAPTKAPSLTWGALKSQYRR
jgi:hypothetical protein